MRRTGRTSRMLLEAVRLAISGKNVIVVAVTHGQAADMFREVVIRGFPGTQSSHSQLKITFAVGSIKFKHASSDDIDWNTGRVLGDRSEVLFDHYAIERRYNWVLKMWQRFNMPDYTLQGDPEWQQP